MTRVVDAGRNGKLNSHRDLLKQSRDGAQNVVFI